MLHITSGDHAADALRAADPGGDVLPWRDVLWDGPLPDVDVVDGHEFATVRARFLAGRGWGTFDGILADFDACDARLDAATRTSEPVVLWFEHDLHDQLQLAQLLARLESHPAVELICIDRHPDIERFLGLGQLSSAQLAALYPSRTSVPRAAFELAVRAWRASCASSPQGLLDVVAGDTSPLPFLADAFRRWLAEYPSTVDGLSMSERRILSLLREVPRSPPDLFAAFSAAEPAPFMGDWSFWCIVASLCGRQVPFVQVVGGGAFRYPPNEPEGSAFDGQCLALTRAGADVLDGRLDAVQVNEPDRWIGGVHLRADNPWRCDPNHRVVWWNRPQSRSFQ